MYYPYGTVIPVLCQQTPVHPLRSYFPQQLLDELSRLTDGMEVLGSPNGRDSTGASSSRNRSQPAADSSSMVLVEYHPPSNPPADRTPSLPISCWFEVIHSTRYVPLVPLPWYERTETQIVGTCHTLQEANSLAMKELREKYGGFAHIGRPAYHPPYSDWLHRAGTGSRSNTWQLKDGMLSFSVVYNRQQRAHRDRVYVVKHQTGRGHCRQQRRNWN
ncbi:hypothetical protein F4777DRAFT_599340 [Nemania sp. FL0916]|nr:hypothetical protein F4777DRAFT_599340 [Nemania sp. FL0916]